MLGDDLQQVLAGQVIAGFQINDLHLAARPDEACDVFQRHVIRRLGVIEPAAGVALDQKRLVGIGHRPPSPFFSQLQWLRCREA
jgi:hypothetical protein